MRMAFHLAGGWLLAVALSVSTALAQECGLLLLKSEPAGCSIEADGVSIGTTPRLVTTLDAAVPHRITLRKGGYLPSTFEVRLNGRTPLLRNEKLVLDSGVIRIATEPAGAEVSVNGIVRGKSPIDVDGIPRGRATVRLRLDGYAEEVRELTIGAAETQTLSLALTGLPGTINLTSLPTGARLYLNGEFVGKAPLALAKQGPGDYEIRAELDGYATVTRNLTLRNGESLNEELRLSNVMGRLEVRTSPAGARVVVDGHVMGVTTTNDPDAEFSDVFSVENLAEGEHVLHVRLDGYAESVRHPKIRQSKTSNANVRLRRVLKPDTEILTDSGTYRGMLISNTPDYVTIEVKLGVQRSFPRSDIRNIRILTDENQ